MNCNCNCLCNNMLRSSTSISCTISTFVICLYPLLTCSTLHSSFISTFHRLSATRHNQICITISRTTLDIYQHRFQQWFTIVLPANIHCLYPTVPVIYPFTYVSALSFPFSRINNPYITISEAIFAIFVISHHIFILFYSVTVCSTSAYRILLSYGPWLIYGQC